MAIADDISVATNGDIRYTGSSANYTVIELHRRLQDLADDASSAGDDLLDITNVTPSERSTDNIITLLGSYNIDDTLAQHLYDGSIIQAAGATIYDGIVNYGVAGIYIDVIQNGALVTNFWTTGLNADANQGISHRFLVKVRTGGADIDGRRLIGTTREFGKTYYEFKINGTIRGNNTLALTNSTDLNNSTESGTVATWTTITNTEGYRAIDVNNDSTDEYYYSEWNRDSYTINQLFERVKYLTRRGTSSTVYGLNGALFRGITHEITVDTPTGTFDAVEPVSWSTGTGQMLAINSTTAATKMWIQLLTGSAPTDGLTITGDTSSATCAVNVTVTERSLSFPIIGASTGSAIIGAYGVGIEAADLSASDKVTDLGGNLITPPNNVVFTVGGLTSGEDRVLVAPESGGGIDLSQLTVSGIHTVGTGTLQVTTTIPSDTPSSGTIRVWNETIYERIPYASYSGDTFTLTGTLGTQIEDTSNCYVSYIDKLADAATATFSSIYLSDRSLYCRVRDGGASPIKTFETTATLGAAGGSVTAIRTSDE